MRRVIKASLWSIALIASLATGLYLNAKESEMPKKIMMYYGGFEIEEMFDASRWFLDGIYQPRNEADGRASNITMLRTRPLPFAASQYAELPLIASSELRDEFPDLDRTTLIDNPPDLRQRVRYAYSAFAEPNKPEDYYYLYLALNNRRFVITFSRDAKSGEILSGKSAKEISGDYASQAEHRKAFAEIEEIERKAR
ncbi:MAG: hypothetical protein CVV09_08555 [Gammaproteobacteria bacterium HGW-Gammaproteobacteria-13]|nr:MAG: hypothetical protein CVV09_08555 [Gammaproteobacteria bacterium HGW-Gammaproteobacteria-13]